MCCCWGLSTVQSAGAISGLHLLPIYPSSGDGGFAPLTYQDVDPRFGTWDDVKALGAEYDLQMECMVNHISPASKEFQDYLAKGDKSEFRELFIDWNKLWGGGPILYAEDHMLHTAGHPSFGLCSISSMSFTWTSSM